MENESVSDAGNQTSLRQRCHRGETGAETGQKRGDKNTKAGRLGEEIKKQNNRPLQGSVEKFPLQNIPRLSRGKQRKKDSHLKTQASRTSRQTILTGPSREQFNPDVPVVLFTLNGTSLVLIRL